ncbi:MAG: cytochrome b [Legionellales bacterium]|nr:cytochrome b [Legionellales bacterium]
MNQQQRLTQWIDERLPIRQFWRNHLTGYYAPKNFNFWYFFGGFALVVLANQFLTGIWLAMFYTPTASEAFASVEYIMRDVSYGWLLRYLHSTGASLFFIVIYLHMLRSIMYGSYQRPRELIWLFGMGLFVLLLAEAFFGYLLPWGQMSYWAAQVITSLFSAIPWVGDDLAQWVRGDYNVSDVTLHRFYALHIVGIPLLLLSLVWLHLVTLHRVGSNNPDGVDIKARVDETGKPLDGMPFHPFYTVKDLFGVAIFLIVFCVIVFFFPMMGGYFLEPENFIPADPLVTPEHIAPVWYMTPFYAMLRAVPNKLGGVMTMAASVAILFILPWLDRSPVRSIRYRGVFSKIALAVLCVSFVSLGYLGTVTVTPVRQWLAQLFTLLYFAVFLLMPIYTRFETTKPVPDRVRMH